MKLLFSILFLITVCWALIQPDQNRLENALDQLKIFPGEKLLKHFKYLQAKVVPITNDCYNTTLNANGDKTNIFKENLRDVIRKYFKAFPHLLVGLSNEKYVKRVSVLVNNLAKLVEKVYKCENIKKKDTRQQQQLCLTSVASLISAESSGFSNLDLQAKFFQHRIDVPFSELCARDAFDNEQPPPNEFNWNSEGYVSPPKEQGECNTCFIFAPVAAAESAWYRFKGKPTGEKFSEQAILNCMYEGKPPNEDPCGKALGGNPYSVLMHMIEHGLTLAENEPYINKTGHCKNYPVAAKPVSYCWISSVNDEILKRHLFRNGPLTVMIDINNLSFVCHGQSYKGPCLKKSFHSVLLIGYDEEFWYFKNSWGDDWADKGFFKMSRDSKLCEECSIYNSLAVPLFKV